MTFGTAPKPAAPAMTGKPATSYEPTAEQLEGVDPNREKVRALAVEIDTKVAEGVDKLHDALTAEFSRPPFSVQAQSALARIDRVVVQIRGRRA